MLFCGRKEVEEEVICDEDDKLVCEEAHCVLESLEVALFVFCWLLAN